MATTVIQPFVTDTDFDAFVCWKSNVLCEYEYEQDPMKYQKQTCYCYVSGFLEVSILCEMCRYLTKYDCIRCIVMQVQKTLRSPQ